MRFSIRLNNDLPLEQYIRLAQATEEAGFDQFWVSNDLFLRSAWVILSAVAQATKRIQIGTGIANPYTVHPSEIAMAAATLDELSGGRFNLGLAAGAADFLAWVGIEQERPLTALRETIHVVRRLLNEKQVPFDGRFLHGWTAESYMRFPTRPVPLYIGAMGPKMLRLTGQIGDGGLPLLFPPEHYETVIRYIHQGAAEMGRSPDEIDVAACVWCSISSDREAARRVLKDKVAYYGHALGSLIYEQLGVPREDFAPLRDALIRERDPEKARALVTPEMLRIGMVGTAKDVIRRLESVVEMGARHLSFGPPLGPDHEEAIAILGREVLPHFRAEGSR